MCNRSIVNVSKISTYYSNVYKTWFLFHFIDSSCIETVKKQTRNNPMVYKELKSHNESGYVFTNINTIYIHYRYLKWGKSFLKIILKCDLSFLT